MSDTKGQQAEKDQGLSRRDFLKFSSLAFGALALPGLPPDLDGEAPAPAPRPLDPQLHFQWQNEILCKAIYPMREAKLRDFLVYYQEVDAWARYKGRDMKSLAEEEKAYKREWEAKAAAALGEFERLRDYFRTEDVRSAYAAFQPVDEEELTAIHALHREFSQSWPRDIRGERDFVDTYLAQWALHRQGIRDWIKARKRRLELMAPDHPKRPVETQELAVKESTTLPMAEQELAQLRALLATYDRIEEPRLAWYRLSRNDPQFKIPEAEYLAKFPADQAVGPRDLARWRVESYTASIAARNQYELLDEVYQRFLREPRRFPAWLQYMVVHFSGMRYASAHYSWADPRDLLIRLSAMEFEGELKALDDVEIERRCREKAEVYESAGRADKPALALAAEAEWRERVRRNLLRVKASGPRTRRAGLLELLTDEVRYEVQGLETSEVLSRLKGRKESLPGWAWKEAVRFTPLRVTEAAAADWEKLTPQEEQERYLPQNNALRALFDAWENTDPTGWRAEHGRTLELNVTRAVCNETAEHCQHLRGHLPPGGLASRARWYRTHETENDPPGSSLVRPTSAGDFAQGASILWLRFVNSSTANPAQWNVARWIETQQKVGLLPAEFFARGARDRQAGWVYKFGNVITRWRESLTPDKRKVVEKQWLRWIHEATVAEVAETADGMAVITFETGLPGSLDGSSAVGINKAALDWLLTDGPEDQYNRCFTGFVPERQVPAALLRKMLDWNRIFRRKVV